MDGYSFSALTLGPNESQAFEGKEQIHILFAAEGGAFFGGAERGILSMNEYYIVSAGEHAEVHTGAEDTVVLWVLRVSREMLTELQDEEEDLWGGFIQIPRHYMDGRNPNNMIIRELLQNLVYNQSQPYLSKTYIRLHVGIIAVVIARTCRIQPQGETRVQLLPMTMTDVYGYVRTHLQGDLSLEAIARALHISKSHLSHMFREEAGISVHQYVLARRLEYANGLLRKGIDVEKTAMRCGFQSAETIIRAYKKRWGITPGQYSKMKKER